MNKHTDTINSYVHQHDNVIAPNGAGLIVRHQEKQDLHHYDNVSGRGVIVYLLKAYVGSDKPNWEYEFNECDYPDYKYEDGSYEFPQYALGVYSKGEYNKAKSHGKQHTARTGEKTMLMETALSL